MPTTSAIPSGTLAPIGKRTASIRDVVLKPGEWTLVGLHPLDSEIAVRAEASGLEICPGSEFPEDAFTIDFSGLTCSALNGTFTTPRRAGGHVAFGIRNTTQGVVSIPVIEISYEASDKFFMVTLPPLPSKQSSPRVEFTPLRDNVVGAGVFLGRSASPVEPELVQNGAPLSKTSLRYDGDGTPYGPASLNQQIAVRTTNTTPDLLDRYAFFLAWA